ncbi:MAG: 3-oxoacyl-ACP reductase FabG [Saprospiraceae bacterium]
MQLKNQVAIVTGGARGIGAGVSRVFCEQGATVVIWDVVDGAETANKITAAGGKAEFHKVDITDRKSVQDAANAIREKHGRIDILINNAGIVRDRSFAKMTDQEWDSVISVNLTGVYNCTKAVLPHMKEAGYGRIVSASSINAHLGAFGQTNYAATKAAVIGFTKSLAREIGKDGITANVVAPGFVVTDMTNTMPEEMLKGFVKTIPVRRAGTPEDMAYAYLYLASPHAGYVNGATLNVNGGLIG